jgi:hypothetical protein
MNQLANKLAHCGLLRHFVLAAMIAALYACGGGGSNEDASADDIHAGPPELTSSKGDASRYLGTWHSACGMRPGSNFMLLYATIDFVFIAAQGSDVSGTMTMRDYGNSTTCRGTPTVSSAPLVLHVDNSTTPVRGTQFIGTLDQVTISSEGLVGPVGFVGFYPGYRAFRLGFDPEITTGTLSYAKQ